MRKVWSQLGLEPWDYEIALRVERGMPEHEAKSFVVMRWMKAGDPRPLLAAIKKEGLLRGPVLRLLAQMLESGQLAFKKKGRGRPLDPEAAVRDLLAADMYGDFPRYYQVGSDNLFRAIGSVTGSGEESVRQAVTAKRNTRRKPKT